MFYKGTVGEVKLSHHRSSSFRDITSLSTSENPISLDIILPVVYKEKWIIRGIYGFIKHTKFMHLVELIYFTFSTFIPHGESLQIFSSEITKSLLFCSNWLGFNIIYGNIFQFIRKIFRGEVEIQVGKVDLCLDARYISDWIYIKTGNMDIHIIFCRT